MVTLYFCLLLSSCENSGGRGTIGETAFRGELPDNPAGFSEPLSLRLVVNDTYCTTTACECIHFLASREYEELLQILKKDYKIDLELVYVIDEYYLEDSILTMKFDGAICKPWFVYQYLDKTDIKPTRIVDILDPFVNGYLAGTFIVKKNSPIMEPSDINGKTLVIGEENSFEKYHSVMNKLKDAGIKPKKIKSVSACTEGINALLDNVAEVAVISDYALVASCAVDLAEEDAFRTLWQTEDIPLCSLVLDLNKVKKKDAARLQAALLEISGKNIPESFASKGFIKPMPWNPKPYIKKED